MHTRTGAGRTHGAPCTGTAWERRATCAHEHTAAEGQLPTHIFLVNRWLSERRKCRFLWGHSGSSRLALWPVLSFQQKFLGRVQSWSRLGLPRAQGHSWGQGPPTLSHGQRNGGSRTTAAPALHLLPSRGAFLPPPCSQADLFLATFSRKPSLLSLQPPLLRFALAPFHLVLILHLGLLFSLDQ